MINPQIQFDWIQSNSVDQPVWNIIDPFALTGRTKILHCWIILYFNQWVYEITWWKKRCKIKLRSYWSKSISPCVVYRSNGLSTMYWIFLDQSEKKLQCVWPPFNAIWHLGHWFKTSVRHLLPFQSPRLQNIAQAQIKMYLFSYFFKHIHISLCS